MKTSTPEPLTAKQHEVLDFIKSFIKDNGYPPTVREMQDAFDWQSPNAVMNYLYALEQKGWIQRDANKSRAIRVIP